MDRLGEMPKKKIILTSKGEVKFDRSIWIVGIT